MPDDVVLRQAKAEAFLNGDGVSLDLGRPVHVMQAVVPEVLPLRELPQVGQFVARSRYRSTGWPSR